jgi:spore photoproduct lyase
MEDESLWREVFGYEYISNNQFEEFMKEAYMKKVEGLRVQVKDGGYK